MKHAYLIIAHNEFDILQKLIHALDDARNDIYIMIDKKASAAPVLICNSSGLYILDSEQQVAIYWGHISQIHAELALLKTAYENGPYQYYHIISGTHLPLKNQNFIHEFYDKHKGKQILQPMAFSMYEITMKMKKKHFFLRQFRHSNKYIRQMAQVAWRRFLVLQSFLKLEANKNASFVKAANWVSITHDFVAYLLERKNVLQKKYRHSFCGDEFFVPSELATSPFAETCFFYPWLIYSKIEKDTAQVIKPGDCKGLLGTDYLFARKFSASDIDSVDMVLEHLKKAS